MKKTIAFLLIAVLASCKSGNTNQSVSQINESQGVVQVGESGSKTSENSNSMLPDNFKYNPADGRTFGVVGPVKEILLSKCLISTTSNDEQGDPWLEQDLPLFAFDENGRVTLDNYGFKYEWDSEGNFVKGFSEKTKFSRDDKGRISVYNNALYEPGMSYSDFDFDNYYVRTYRYDEEGRIAEEEFGGWEWGNTYKYYYEGDNIYPSRIEYYGAVESTMIKGTITYHYHKFDKMGNWTECYVTHITVETEDGGDAEPVTTTTVTQDIRTIRYWQ